MSASSSALIIGCMVRDVKQATELTPLIFVPQQLFSGFFIRTSQIPVFMRWGQWLCGLKFGMNLILLTEFSGENAACKGKASKLCTNVIKSNDIRGEDWWIYFLLLVVIFVAFRIIGALILIQKAKRFY